MKKTTFWLGVVIFGFVVGLVVGMLAPLPAPPGTSVPQIGMHVERAATNNPMPAIVATAWFIEPPLVVTMLAVLAVYSPLVRRYWPPLYGRPPERLNLLV